MKRLLSPVLSALLGAIVGAIVVHQLAHEETPKVHKLQYPLMLTGGNSDSPAAMLPRGTSLYFDRTFPEGFVRYKVYINVEGTKLEPRDAAEKFWLDPLTATPFDKDSLHALLTRFPLGKHDFSAVLGSGQLTKEEIRDLLRAYSE
ncbi:MULTISPECIES: hypothetical protein [Cupriavidus]|uniref:hypothetical protein n=1 Tax=Cupriavidus TaxID=106589 RepID=UPI000E1628F0|nr:MULTISPECIES: hypothetical protein [Cupriavidus]MEC3766280.1 hypothetical protein [Cupriavidus sp. SS-3]SOY97633.1 conserved hypothetical protein; PUTATIVE MEMBRANE anchored protein [Cupriavidus taiwanensis]SOZ00292.1 conserved hypothetical protein; PUTATIVE MEMBRANE anchored protein [Cupriavidus taiwanensis]